MDICDELKFHLENKISYKTQEINLTQYFTKFDDKSQKILLEDACAYVDSEIASLKDKIARIETDIMRYMK